MANFKLWLVESEEQDDIKKTLAELPKSHADLVRGYTVKFQGGNTMKGDESHIGMVDDQTKTITLAAPWRYPRSYTYLHEIGHLVWAHFVTPEMKKEWSRLALRNKTENPQNDEEEFCMSYAQHFANNKLIKYHLPERNRFVKTLVDNAR